MDYINSVCFSQDGKYIASGSHDKNIQLWNVENSEQEGNALHLHHYPAGHFKIIPNGWLLDHNSNLICWIPPNLHVTFYMPGTAMIFGKKYDKLQIFPHKLGAEWLKCATQL